MTQALDFELKDGPKGAPDVRSHINLACRRCLAKDAQRGYAGKQNIRRMKRLSPGLCASRLRLTLCS